MKFDVNFRNQNVSDLDLLSDLVKVHSICKTGLTKSKYNELGKFSTSTYERRFGTWNNALKKAKLQLSTPRVFTDEELFKNIEEIWIKLGRQPKSEEVKQPLSKFSVRPYLTRFGKWYNALEAFIDYMNNDLVESKPTISEDSLQQKSVEQKIVHKTRREVSDRMRFRILMRDGFTCKKCGRSPIKDQNVELHVDHIKPWSKGGETILENLETKCKKCNLGKGNAFII